MRLARFLVPATVCCSLLLTARAAAKTCRAPYYGMAATAASAAGAAAGAPSYGVIWLHGLGDVGRSWSFLKEMVRGLGVAGGL